MLHETLAFMGAFLLAWGLQNIVRMVQEKRNRRAAARAMIEDVVKSVRKKK